MTMDVEERIKNSGLHLEEVVPNASELAETDQHAFAMLRRVGLGASDSSIILGVNLYTKLDELIQQKRSTEVTEDITFWCLWHVCSSDLIMHFFIKTWMCSCYMCKS